MTSETKHLLKWWKEWGKRFLLTSYHLINRKAYRKWKKDFAIKKQKERKEGERQWKQLLEEEGFDIFHDLNEFH